MVTEGAVTDAWYRLVQRIKVRARKTLFTRTELELRAKEATSVHPWGPTEEQLRDLATSCRDSSSIEEVGPVLLQRLGRSGTAWTQVYKALVAIEHLVLHSSPEWVSWAVEVAGPCICQLQTFQHVDSEDQDWGAKVRAKAAHLDHLLRRPAKLSRMRGPKGCSSFSSVESCSSAILVQQ
ncbi:hypothetical protein ACKKBG_A01765 [Auxenochlorella protothecoides x Auxenochlorella symbiontica]|uniref:ENTH domain-containing protein n=1 Tax=Auxenochlorella protothecoides TaxID=3075 RepID=A0A1D1ZSJ7_AUXPR